MKTNFTFQIVKKFCCFSTNNICEIVIFIVIPMLFFLAIDRECVVVKLGVPLEGVPLIPSWWDMPNATWRRFHAILI